MPRSSPPPGGPLVLRDREVGELLGVSRRTVWRLSSRGELPAPIEIGGSRRWLREEITAAILEFATARPRRRDRR